MTQTSTHLRCLGGVLLAAVASLLLLLLGVSPALAYPPAPPGAAASRTNLDGLAVQAESNSGYDRDRFDHWIAQGDGCDTREVVLQRDGSGVAVGDDCRPTAGRWYSVYDQVWLADSSDVDIDHVVPLAEAWGSGATSWGDARRTAFANDLGQPQLIAVSAGSNRSKSDRDPAEWKPTSAENWCLYARNWIQVKHAYTLSVDAAEKTALTDMLATC
jgi:hypothetical protein